MSTATKTLKLPFLRLNRTKADEFARLQTLNTATANVILAMPKDERRTLTADFRGAKLAHSSPHALQHFSRSMGSLSSVL